MAKKRDWCSLVRRLFISEGKSKSEKKSKRWRWVFGRFKAKQFPVLAASQTTLSEAREEQRKHVLTAAIATATAAEAAVAAAHAAAEVVRLTGASQSFKPSMKNNRIWAAIKIQTAFRAHLAQKALRALKGLVRLQAFIRGQAVRRQVITSLTCSTFIANLLPLDNDNRFSAVNENHKESKMKESSWPEKEPGEKGIKLKHNSQRNWDYSMLSKEDLEATWSRKHEEIIRRERMKKYSFSHRERRNGEILEETICSIKNGRLGCRFEQWAHKMEALDNLRTTAYSNSMVDDVIGKIQLKLRNSLEQDLEERLHPPYSLPRRSFSHAKQLSFGDDSFFPSSPVFPSYMAATESAKAKARSMSMPKQRLRSLETCIDHNSPYKNRLSFWSSYDGESLGINKRSSTSQKKSVGMKQLH